MAESKQKPKETAFVSKVVKDPAVPLDVVLLRGFLGASPKEAHSRLYGDATLGTYLEIPNDSIRHAHQMSPGGGAPLGGAFLWVDRDAELVPGPAHGETAGSDQSSENNDNNATDHDLKGTKNMFTVPPYCPQSAGQAAIPTVPASQCLTIPLVCCPLPAGQAQGAVGQGVQGGHGSSQQAILTLPPFCGIPTIFPPTCLPPLCGQGAQAAGQADIPTVPASQCLTIPLVCCPLPAGQAQGSYGQGTQATVFPPTCLPPICAAQTTNQAAIPTIPASQCASVPIVCC